MTERDLTAFPVEAAIARTYGERTLHALHEMARLAEVGLRFAGRGRRWCDGDPEHVPRYACEALIIKLGENVARLGKH